MSALLGDAAAHQMDDLIASDEITNPVTGTLNTSLYDSLTWVRLPPQTHLQAAAPPTQPFHTQHRASVILSPIVPVASFMQKLQVI